MAHSFGSERRWFRDQRTGTKIIQLTSYPAMSTKLSYTTQSWTPDGQWIVFLSQLEWGRGAPMGLFKVRADGSSLVQLTDTHTSGMFACIDWPRDRVVFTAGETIKAVGLTDYYEVDLYHFEGASGHGGMTMHPDGRSALTTFSVPGGCRLVRLDLETGGHDVIFEDRHGFGRAQFCGDGSGTIRFSGGALDALPMDHHQAFWVIEEDGTNLRVPLEQDPNEDVTHDSWLGDSREILHIRCTNDRDTEIYPSQIRAVHVDTGAVRVIARQGSYWHCSSMPDSTRAISDTNWPQRGLVLIDVEKGTERMLCWPGESGGATGWGHPHPSFSPDGSHVCFNSDVTGTAQIYTAEVDR
jgi:oligogalacturonide lyase